MVRLVECALTRTGVKLVAPKGLFDPHLETDWRPIGGGESLPSWAASKTHFRLWRDRMVKRCDWTGSDPLMVDYHDREWGVPVHDDRLLFEFLVLEGAQAGLSWATILRKRDNYRAAFDGFDLATVAAYDDSKVAALLSDPGIVRNRLKVRAAIQNARALMVVQLEFGSFDRYQWSFVGGEPHQNSWNSMSEIPATSPESEALSKDLKKRGFRFVGPTICYAHMQAVGMVNDHVVSCFRHGEISRALA